MRHATAAGAFVLLVVLFPFPAGASEGSAPPAPGPIAAAVRRAVLPPSMPSQSGSRKGTWIGAALGAGGAAAVTYWAAKTYGENEAGGFCNACFWQWGAWTIPAGALVGGIVGSLLNPSIAPQPGALPRKTLVAPVVGRRGGGVVVSVRY